MRSSVRLERSYSSLRTGERARLAIAALARGDEREHERLTGTCRKQKYVGCEHAYVQVVELASEFATVFAAIEIGPRGAKLELLGAIHLLAVEWLTAQEPADSVQPTGRHGSADFLAVLEAGVEALASEAAAITRGFDEFCRAELRMEVAQLIGAFARPFSDDFERLAANAADPDEVAAYREEMCRAWRRRRGLSPERPEPEDEAG